VDPDNRRPVDYDLRRRLLAELKTTKPEEIWRRIEDGLPKLWLIHQTLKLRHEGHFFAPSDGYRALFPRGAKSAHVIAFARGERSITIVPRLVLKLADDWSDTAIEIPPGVWRNELSGDKVNGGEIRMTDLLKRFPVALLTRAG
jgi:(1->4)-alpha-D-glucan 1-alpha-D-glucosylmutase